MEGKEVLKGQDWRRQKERKKTRGVTTRGKKKEKKDMKEGEKRKGDEIWREERKEEMK